MFRTLFISALMVATPATAQSITWQPTAQSWNREWGSHRVVVRVDAPADAVRVKLDWRRPDKNPQQKAIHVRSLKGGNPLINVLVKQVTNESGEIVFQPVSGAGEYAVYFLPVKIGGGAFPVGKYEAPKMAAEAAWQAAAAGATTEAKPVRWEAISAHDAWNEMEVIATTAEVEKLAASLGEKPAYFRLESREHSLRTFDRLPERWISQPNTSPTLQAQPGEFLAFQAAVWVPQNKAIVNVSMIRLKNMRSESGAVLTVPERDLSFVTRWKNESVTDAGLSVKMVSPGTVQPFWSGFEIPKGTSPGKYRGELQAVLAPTGNTLTLPVEIVVGAEPWKESVTTSPKNMHRLEWLDSREAVDHEPVRGYTAMQVDEGARTVSFLGRRLQLTSWGLPAQIESEFNKAVTRIGPEFRHPLLTAPISFTTGLTPAGPVAKSLRFTEKSPGLVAWSGVAEEGGVTLQLVGSLSADGYLQCQIRLTTPQETLLPDVRLAIPRTPTTCEYIIGMGHEAGTAAKPVWEWKWDVARKNQDSIWMGAVNGGLRLHLLDDTYHRPPVNIHYKRDPLKLPSWGNGGKGSVTFANHVLTAILGERRLGVESQNNQEQGAELTCCFNLLITPFHPLRTEEQWADRYYHTSGLPNDTAKYLDGAKAAGANVINIHQGNFLNPYINYPFLTADRLKAFTDQAHERQMRVKFYYTVRELSNWTPELFAVRSFGDAILAHGKGGGHPWLEEHLGGDYWGAWYEPKVQDVSMLTKPTGPWLNYYVEGLKWLVEHTGCDGLYLDDISYDRETMERCRKVLDRYNPRGGLIDLHSWNEFNKDAGWAQCANIFMDSMPFIDRLWFGEGHHYTGPPADHFLVELSGVPYGLMSEMLEGGGNPWFGLVHGATGRLGWQGNPLPVWKLWDDFGVKGSEFIGWWAGDENPVQTDMKSVKATVWKHEGRTLLALANFENKPVEVNLKINWKQLGLSPDKIKAYAPAMPEMGQQESLHSLDGPLMIKAHQGMALFLDEKAR